MFSQDAIQIQHLEIVLDAADLIGIQHLNNLKPRESIHHQTTAG